MSFYTFKNISLCHTNDKKTKGVIQSFLIHDPSGYINESSYKYNSL